MKKIFYKIKLMLSKIFRSSKKSDSFIYED